MLIGLLAAMGLQVYLFGKHACGLCKALAPTRAAAGLPADCPHGELLFRKSESHP